MSSNEGCHSELVLVKVRQLQTGAAVRHCARLAEHAAGSAAGRGWGQWGPTWEGQESVLAGQGLSVSSQCTLTC